MTNTHTVDEALARFDLIAGAGNPDQGKACAMTLLSWVAGEAWSDHPDCTHPLLSSWAVSANDHGKTTKAQRAEIVKAGEVGILDTWWVPTEVVVWGLSEAPKDSGPVERIVSIAAFVAAWKADKRRPNLRGANLRGANLRDADLRGADLGDADLRGANLRGAYLWGADLGDDDVRGANLRGSNLRGANLRGADLRGANLRDADLRGADLGDADLRGANLRGANASPATTWPAGVDLAERGVMVSA